jgi:hypothetical protein
VLRRSAQGTALFAPDLFNPGAREVALLVRAESGRVARIGANPAVEFRAGLFTQPSTGTALVPILVRVGRGEPEDIYEAWANEFGPGAAALLEALAAQERIGVQLYGDACRLERSLRVPNPLRAFAPAALAEVAGARPLSADAFHQARQAVYKQHATPWSLWRALKR